MRCFSRSLTKLLAAATAGALLGCCGADDAPKDGGADASLDARIDADGPRDAARDTGRDATTLPDAGPVEWRTIPGLPEECPIRIAVEPEAAAPPLVFEPCPGWASGCRQVVVDWEVEGPRFVIGSGYHDGTHGYFWYARGVVDDEIVLVLARDDGSTLSVMRFPRPGPEFNPCLPFPVVFGGGRFAMAMMHFDAPSTIAEHTFLTGTLDAPTDSVAVFAVLDRSSPVGSNGIQRMAVTESHVAFEVVPSHEVFLLDDAGDIVSSTLDLPRSAYLSGAQGSHVFVEHSAAPLEIRVANAGGATEPCRSMASM